MSDALPPKPKSLQDIGTRFTHYTELMHIWGDGFELINRAYMKFPNAKDYLRAAQLEAGVMLIRRQLDILSNYDTEQFKLRNEIESLPRPVKMPKVVKSSAAKPKLLKEGDVDETSESGKP